MGEKKNLLFKCKVIKVKVKIKRKFFTHFGKIRYCFFFQTFLARLYLQTTQINVHKFAWISVRNTFSVGSKYLLPGI